MKTDFAIYTCTGCSKPIAGRWPDPVVTASSLGAGLWHAGCAATRWGEIAQAEVDARKAAKVARSARREKVKRAAGWRSSREYK